jgi:hypothetical protein
VDRRADHDDSPAALLWPLRSQRLVGWSVGAGANDRLRVEEEGGGDYCVSTCQKLQARKSMLKSPVACRERSNLDSGEREE